MKSYGKHGVKVQVHGSGYLVEASMKNYFPTTSFLLFLYGFWSIKFENCHSKVFQFYEEEGVVIITVSISFQYKLSYKTLKVLLSCLVYNSHK